MNRRCRTSTLSWKNREMALRILVHACIVTDPNKLARLHAEASRQNLRTKALLRGKIEKSLLRGDHREI